MTDMTDIQYLSIVYSHLHWFLLRCLPALYITLCQTWFWFNILVTNNTNTSWPSVSEASKCCLMILCQCYSGVCAGAGVLTVILLPDHTRSPLSHCSQHWDPDSLHQVNKVEPFKNLLNNQDKGLNAHILVLYLLLWMILWLVSVVSVPGLLLSWVIHLLWIKPVTELQLVWVWNWSMNLINSEWIIDMFSNCFRGSEQLSNLWWH